VALLKKTVLIALALAAAGCGPAERAAAPEPVDRHLVYEKIVGETGIWIADVNGGRPRLLLADGHAPKISPDGKWVAYLDDCSPSTARCSLFLVSVSRGKSRLLARGSYEEFSWSRDSDRIAGARLLNEQEFDEALLTIDVPSGDNVTLAEGDLYGWSFSPDGKQIVFAFAREPSLEGFDSEKIDLFVANSDGGGESELRRITDTGDSGYPVWGPKSIAFAKLIPYRGWGRHEIWRIQPDGKAREPIIAPTPERFLGQGYVGLIPIGWSDDGSALLVGWTSEFGASAIALDPESAAIHELDGGLSSDPGAISHDGRYVLVDFPTEGRPEDYSVAIVPFAGGKPQVVARGARAPSWNR